MSNPAEPQVVPVKRAVERYGWIPDLPDHRDHLYRVPAPIAANLPPSADLRGCCPVTVYDQGELGSCTANAIAAAVECARLKAGRSSVTPSRLFIYYNERVIEHTVRSDSGAMLRDGIKTVAKQGVCDETTWPYVTDEYQFTVRPPASAYTEAAGHTVTAYQRVDASLDVMRGVLANGHPFVIGFTVYQSFESVRVAKTGVVNLPTGKESMIGGHAVLVVGYDDTSGRFLVRNSWGADWGMGGYFTVPYAYFTDARLASDRWAVTAIA